MKVIRSADELKAQIKREALFPVGFVPTMGALHEGHLSLVRIAAKECSLVVVSIYVNPAQFNNKDDLKNYPRSLEADLSMLGKVLAKNDIVFTPDDKEIYPVEDKRVFNFGNLGNVMEGLYRQGHFNGVAQVVSRLFEIAEPDLAYFGLKDLQQVAIIKEMVRQKGYKVRIVAAPIIRENDGLAMSSRNRLLTQELRNKAPVIYNTLSVAASMIQNCDIPEIKNYVVRTIEKTGGLSVEYFEIVDDKYLHPVNAKSEMKKRKSYFGCIAVWAGKIRLIDNIELQLV